MAKRKLTKYSALVNEALAACKSKTASKKTAVSIKGETYYMSAPLVRGNSKLDKHVFIFDLLAVYSCTNCADCIDGCYAMSAQLQYPGCRVKRTINTILAKTAGGLAQLARLIIGQLRRARSARSVRIHSSGDFLSADYVAMWCGIARAFPDIQFYTYTKTGYAPQLRAAGINVVNSVLPNSRPNFGTPEYVEKAAAAYGCTICPATVPGNNDIKCGRDCSACLNSSNVVFHAHGQNATPEKMPWCDEWLRSLDNNAPRVFMMKREA